MEELYTAKGEPSACEQMLILPLPHPLAIHTAQANTEPLDPHHKDGIGSSPKWPDKKDLGKIIMKSRKDAA